MDFELSADQVALRDAAADLLGGAGSVSRARAVLDAPLGYDAELFKQVVEQGWLALEVPQALGGIGLGFVEVAVLAEQLGRHVAPVPFLSSSLAIAALLGADASPAVADRAAAALERVVNGEAVASVGHVGELFVDAPHAQLVVAIDVAAGAVTLHELAEPQRAEPAMDQTRRVAWFRPADDHGGLSLGGADLATALYDRAGVAYAAELLGASQRMLEVATTYAKTREQFGRPIGSFQAIKHRLADMLVDVEGMRSAVHAAAWSVATDADDRSLAASTAKAWCGDASRRVMESALQVHGGIGFTWEHDLHLYFKRAHLDRTLFGDPTHHLRRLATLLRDRVRAGTDLW